MNEMVVFPQIACNKYFPVTLTQHQEYDTVDDSCEDDSSYSFKSCVQESVAFEIGCGLKKGSNLTCTTVQQYR